jgi:hypothetical protein
MSASKIAADKIKRISEAKCREWVSNPLINPITGSAITENGPTYNLIKTRCLEKYNISLNTAPAAVGQEVNVVEAPAAQAAPAAPAEPEVPVISSSSSRSSSYRRAVSRRRAAKPAGETLTAAEKWAAKRCTNEATDPITLEEMSNNDAENSFVIFMKKRDGEWKRKNSCLRRDDLYNSISSDRFTFIIRQQDAYGYKIPSSCLANWIKKPDSTGIDLAGRGGNAGYKLFIKLPPNNILITLKSYLRIQKEIDTKEWYALPLFNNSKILVGNLLGITTEISISHGQSPGSIIYKLYTKSEIENEQLSVVEDEDEYDTINVKITRDQHDKLLISDDNQTTEYIRKRIKSILFTTPKLILSGKPVSSFKFFKSGIWYRGYPEPSEDIWINPFTSQSTSHSTDEFLKQYFNTVYDYLYRYISTLILKPSMDIFSKTLEFIYYYVSRNGIFGTTSVHPTQTLVIFIVSALIIIVNNTEILSIEDFKGFMHDMHSAEIDETYTLLKAFHDRTHFSEYKSMYELIFECDTISKNNLQNILTINADSLELFIRYVVSKPELYEYSPAYLARHIIKSLLVAGNRIFHLKIDLPSNQYGVYTFSRGNLSLFLNNQYFVGRLPPLIGNSGQRWPLIPLW